MLLLLSWQLPRLHVRKYTVMDNAYECLDVHIHTCVLLTYMYNLIMCYYMYKQEGTPLYVHSMTRHMFHVQR